MRNGTREQKRDYERMRMTAGYELLLQRRTLPQMSDTGDRQDHGQSQFLNIMGTRRTDYKRTGRNEFHGM